QLDRCAHRGVSGCRHWPTDPYCSLVSDFIYTPPASDETRITSRIRVIVFWRQGVNRGFGCNGRADIRVVFVCSRPFRSTRGLAWSARLGGRRVPVGARGCDGLGSSSTTKKVPRTDVDRSDLWIGRFPNGRLATHGNETDDASGF